MSVCVSAFFVFGKQLGSRLFEFRDEQSPGYIARAADCRSAVCPCVRLVSGLSGNGDSDRSSWSPFKKKIED